MSKFKYGESLTYRGSPVIFISMKEKDPSMMLVYREDKGGWAYIIMVGRFPSLSIYRNKIYAGGYQNSLYWLPTKSISYD